MEILDAATAVALGGLDARYARVLAVSTIDCLAAVLIDTNGDGTMITVDEYEASADGGWILGLSRSAGESGSSWSTKMVSAWGCGDSWQSIEVQYAGNVRLLEAGNEGWWLFIAAAVDGFPHPPRALPRRA